MLGIVPSGPIERADVDLQSTGAVNVVPLAIAVPFVVVAESNPEEVYVTVNVAPELPEELVTANSGRRECSPLREIERSRIRRQCDTAPEPTLRVTRTVTWDRIAGLKRNAAVVSAGREVSLIYRHGERLRRGKATARRDGQPGSSLVEVVDAKIGSAASADAQRLRGRLASTGGRAEAQRSRAKVSGHSPLPLHVELAPLARIYTGIVSGLFAAPARRDDDGAGIQSIAQAIGIEADEICTGVTAVLVTR